jgi:hypothetical protein
MELFQRIEPDRTELHRAVWALESEFANYADELYHIGYAFRSKKISEGEKDAQIKTFWERYKDTEKKYNKTLQKIFVKGIKDIIFSDNKEDAVKLLIACNGILDEPRRIKELLLDLGYESPSGKFWRKAKKILFPF